MTPEQINALPYRPCVGIMVLNAQDEVWMGRRIKSPTPEESNHETKLWQMPQGGIDKREDPFDAAKRELWEETGITSATCIGRVDEWLSYDLPAERIGVALRGKWRGQKQLWFAFRFTGEEAEINISNPPDGAPVEFDQWEWVEMSEVPKRIVEFKRKIYEQVVGEFSRLSSED